MSATAEKVGIVKWNQCYDKGWRGLIVPEAFAHPAKMARGLVARIFDELFARGALTRGSIVVDPFGGIGTTAIEGASRGVQVVCCELEPKFVALALENIWLHRRDWEHMALPIPRITMGDSRRLRQHVGPVLAECCISSPPYSPERLSHGGGKTYLAGDTRGTAQAMLDGYGETPGQLGQMREGDVDAIISSPPYAEIASGAGGLNTKPARDGQQCGRSSSSPSQDTDQRYGESAGQLARMPLGAVAEVVVSSPPYAGNDKADNTLADRDPLNDRMTGCFRGSYGRSDGQLGAMPSGNVDAIVCSPPFASGDSASAQSITERSDKSAEWVKKNCGSAATQGYGVSDGQLGVMKMGDVADALVSSPPYEACDTRPTEMGNGKPTRADGDDPGRNKGDYIYGETDGQLGIERGETFWSAALDIVRESYAVLRPGGTAIWVVKAFVRDKQIVDLPGDWRKLCEHVGFVTETEVHAMLVHEETKPHLFDGEITTRRERKSFFRRLAEKKGSPAVDFEVVYFMRKPLLVEENT